jgi:molecular chaperone GrpE
MMADKTAPATDNPAEDAAAEDSDGIEASAADAAQAEVADLKNKLLRTLAEMENLRRRTEREMSDARQYAVANFAREMLTVSDNLKRAIDAVPAELRDGSDPALSALIEGVEVTEKGLQQALTKHGVKRIDAKGAKFDPAFHQAMFEMETAEVPAGTVAEEIQPGYVIGERVLRPALVGVAKRAKGGGKAQQAPEEDSAGDSGPQAA